MTNTERLAEALRRLIDASMVAMTDQDFATGETLSAWEDANEALAAHESAAEPARLTDEQRIDWLCEEAVYHCGQWQVVFDSDKDSFIDAIDEMAAIAHGIGATTGAQR